MQNKIDLVERDTGIVKEYRGGATMQVIADTHKISRQRVEQILRLAGVERGGKRKIKEVIYTCQECGKEFKSYQKGRKFCSLKCSHSGRRSYKTEEEISARKKELRTYYAGKSNDYYHNVFKKRSDWKDIVKGRNQRAAIKRKK